MAKKVSEPTSGTATSSTKASRSRWRPIVLGTLGLVTLAGAGGWLWLQHQETAVLVRALPIVPDLSARSPALREKIASAEAAAASSGASLHSVADLGRLYHANGFAEQAEACWSVLQKREPQNAHWSYYRADLRLAAFDETGARTWLEATTRLDPGYAPAWLRLAELEFKNGRFADATKAYEQVLGTSADDPYAVFGLARIALQQGRREEGKKRLETLMQKTPAFPSAHNLYAELLAADGDAVGAAKQRWLGTTAGRFHAAADPWLEELRGWCYEPVQLIVWGTAEQQTGRRPEAETLFRRAIDCAPDDPRPYHSLGKLYLEAEQPEKARAALEKAAALEPNERVWVDLSEAYLGLNRPADALRIAEQGLALSAASADLLNARGVALEALNRLAEAIDAYRTALTRGETATTLTNLGVALLRQGKPADARSSLQRALERQPMFPKALIVLGRLELSEGRLDVAERYIRPYYEQYPGLATARDLMAKWCLQSALKAARAGDPAAAERACREGLAADANAVEIHGFLGVLYTQQGRLNEALEALQTAHKLRPDDPRATLGLAEVYVRLHRVGDARALLTIGQQRAEQRGDTALARRYAEIARSLPQ